MEFLHRNRNPEGKARQNPAQTRHRLALERWSYGATFVSPGYLLIRETFFFSEVCEQLIAIEDLDGRFLEVFLIARNDEVGFQLECALVNAGIFEVAPRRIECSVHTSFG